MAERSQYVLAKSTKRFLKDAMIAVLAQVYRCVLLYSRMTLVRGWHRHRKTDGCCCCSCCGWCSRLVDATPRCDTVAERLPPTSLIAKLKGVVVVDTRTPSPTLAGGPAACCRDASSHVRLPPICFPELQ